MIAFKFGKKPIGKNRCARREDFGGPKRNRFVAVSANIINIISLGAIKGHFLAVHSKEILPEKLAKFRKYPAKATYYGVITAHRIFGLGHIDDK